MVRALTTAPARATAITFVDACRGSLLLYANTDSDIDQKAERGAAKSKEGRGRR